jgi:hypothetical protein
MLNVVRPNSLLNYLHQAVRSHEPGVGGIGLVCRSSGVTRSGIIGYADEVEMADQLPPALEAEIEDTFDAGAWRPGVFW